MHHHQANAWKGLAAGLVAGLAATYVMTRFQELSGKLEKKLKEDDDAHHPQHSAKRGKPESAEKRKEGDDATVKAAAAISRGLFDHELSREEKKVAGPAMHYSFGALTGAMYGALAELAPEVTRGAGAPFGTAVWLGADEVAVPAFRLSGPPWETPPSVHARALAAHLVYGLTTEGVRRLVRRAF
jgi:putative membrane protein